LAAVAWPLAVLFAIVDGLSLSTRWELTILGATLEVVGIILLACDHASWPGEAHRQHTSPRRPERSPPGRRLAPRPRAASPAVAIR
jgi:hypothetical protein